METMPERPIKNTYWVEPGRFLAGQYPGDLAPVTARRKIRKLVEGGFTRFIDLTHPDNRLDPYENYLDELRVDGAGAPERLAHPILDVNVPEHPDRMHAILEEIEDGLREGHGVYVHCRGGVGWTGTVVGCYLVRQGLSGPEAVMRLQELWTTCERYPHHPRSPETDAQRDYVKTWEQWERR